MSFLHNYTNFPSSGRRSQIIAALRYRVAFISHIIRTYRQNKSGCFNSFSNSLLYTCASVSRTARDYLFNTVCGGVRIMKTFFMVAVFVVIYTAIVLFSLKGLGS